MERVVIVGLGNPGREYEGTRHNLGQMVIQEFARKHGFTFKEDKKCLAEVAKGALGNTQVHLLFPTTFMNESGRSVRKYCDYMKFDPSDLIVVVDDVELPFEMMRVRVKGSHGGHNGLRSLQQHLGTDSYLRLRMGVSRGDVRKSLETHVLERFTKIEAEQLDAFVTRAVDALEALLNQSIEQVMNKINEKVQNDRREEESV